MLNFVVWCVIGAIVGGLSFRAIALCARLTGTLCVASAMAGASIAGFVLAPLLGVNVGPDAGFSFGAMGVALLGAMSLMLLIARYHVPRTPTAQVVQYRALDTTPPHH